MRKIINMTPFIAHRNNLKLYSSSGELSVSRPYYVVPLQMSTLTIVYTSEMRIHCSIMSVNKTTNKQSVYSDKEKSFIGWRQNYSPTTNIIKKTTK